MKKKLIIYLCLSVFSLVGFYFLYQWFENKKLSPLWKNIPADAQLVIEIKKPAELINNWKNIPSWINFLHATGSTILLNKIVEQNNADKKFSAYLSRNEIVASLHHTSGRQQDYIYYFPLFTPEDLELFENQKNNYKQKSQFKYGSRNFNGSKIIEILDRSHPGEIFSFTVRENVLIGSYTSLLIEEVIRNAGKKKISSQKINKTVFNNDEETVNIYINGTGLSNFAGTMASDEKQTDFNWLKNAFSYSKLQLIPFDDQIVAFGKTQFDDDETSTQYLKLLSHQQAQPIACAHLLPENVAIFYHWGISDPGLFEKDLKEYWVRAEPDILKKMATAENLYHLNLKNFNNYTGKEMAICRLENTEENSRLMFIKSSNTEKAVDLLNLMAKSVDLKLGASPYTENYNGFNIRQIHLSQFPTLLFGSAANGFDHCFYAQYEDYIVIGSGLETLKRWYDDVVAQKVWGKNHPIFKKLQDKSNFTFVTDISRSWPFIINETDKSRFLKLTERESFCKNFSFVALQIQASGKEFQTNIFATYHKSNTSEKVLGKAFINHQTTLDTSANSAPFLFNRVSGKSILIQDKKNILYNIDQNGKITWKKNLSQPLTGEIFLTKNTISFISGQNLHQLSLNGDDLENFPLGLTQLDGIHQFSAISYDGKKEFRYLASDITGNIGMYNQAGKILQGWSPKSSGVRLIKPVTHFRIAGKDYLNALQINGDIQVWNRKGQALPGFPLKTRKHLNSGVFIKKGAGLAETFIIVISENGELIEINLLGKIVNTKQIFRPTADPAFNIIMDTEEKDWFIIRQEHDNVEILNKQGNILFEKPMDNLQKNSIVQYYDFGADVKLFFITHPTHGKTYIFDRNGKELSTEIDNNKAVEVLYQPSLDKILIYCTNEKYLRLVSVKVR